MHWCRRGAHGVSGHLRPPCGPRTPAAGVGWTEAGGADGTWRCTPASPQPRSGRRAQRAASAAPPGRGLEGEAQSPGRSALTTAAPLSSRRDLQAAARPWVREPPPPSCWSPAGRPGSESPGWQGRLSEEQQLLPPTRTHDTALRPVQLRSPPRPESQEMGGRGDARAAPPPSRAACYGQADAQPATFPFCDPAHFSPSNY